jgi:hypothetical protein
MADTEEVLLTDVSNSEAFRVRSPDLICARSAGRWY